jgi:hypothetical protein
MKWVGRKTRGITGERCIYLMRPYQLRRLHPISHGVNLLQIQMQILALGGLVVSVLATGPKDRGFKPGRGQ